MHDKSFELFKSLLTPWHRSAGAVWEQCFDSQLVSSYKDAEVLEVDQSLQIGIADLSPLPRIGFKGPESDRWLETQGYSYATALNRAYLQHDGSLICRLAENEMLWLNGFQNPCPPPDIGMNDAGCYAIRRQDSHIEVVVLGAATVDMMAKLCAVDLSPHAFQNLSIAQTSVARLSAIIVRSDIAETPAMRILVDSSSARYFWQCLLDAMEEYGE